MWNSLSTTGRIFPIVEHELSLPIISVKRLEMKMTLKYQWQNISENKASYPNFKLTLSGPICSVPVQRLKMKATSIGRRTKIIKQCNNSDTCSYQLITIMYNSDTVLIKIFL